MTVPTAGRRVMAPVTAVGVEAAMVVAGSGRPKTPPCPEPAQFGYGHPE
jgi:hypothetical protein